MKNKLLFTGMMLSILVLAGCGNGDSRGDGISQADRDSAASANKIAVSVNGDFDKLTPDQKKQFILLAGGSEGQARRLVSFMAHPPVRGGGENSGAQSGGPALGPHPPGGTQ